MEKKLLDLAEQVINLFDDVDLEFSRHNAFHFLVNSFYLKQRTHLISLLEINKTFDSQLVCRTMIEGFALLHYFRQNCDFSQKWLEQGEIENLKLLETKEQSGLTVDDLDRDRVLLRANKLAHRLKPNAKINLEQTGRRPRFEDFKPLKPTMKTMVKDLSKINSYWADVYSLYDRFSKWQHWNVVSVFEYADVERAQLKTKEVFPHYFITTCYGVFCLIMTSQILDEALSLNKTKKIDEFMRELVNIQKQYSES